MSNSPRRAAVAGDAAPTLTRLMHVSSLSALSPLDGRYAGKVEALRPLLSEYGLMHWRVRVEIEWFIALLGRRHAELPAAGRRGARLSCAGLVARILAKPTRRRSRTIERTTNHDVKAVEYWLASASPAIRELAAATEFVHFACTSEDINNTSHALMLAGAREQVLLPAIDRIVAALTAMAASYAAHADAGRTHGQTASPTTLGKEIANVAARLARRARGSPRSRCWPR